MSFGLIVDAQQLRSGADKMKQLADKAGDIAPDPESEAKGADSANRGFMPGEACTALSDDFKKDMKELQEHWADTGELLDEIAEDWEEIDKESANEFDGIGGELESFRGPGL